MCLGVLDTTFSLNNTMTALRTARGFFRHLRANNAHCRCPCGSSDKMGMRFCSTGTTPPSGPCDTEATQSVKETRNVQMVQINDIF